MDPRAVLNQALKTWRSPEELVRSRPRDVSLTCSGAFIVGLALIMLFAGMAAGFGLYIKFSRDLEIRNQILRFGSDAQARITRHFISNGKARTHYVEYTYQISGHTYVGRQQIEPKAWPGLLERGILNIRYLRMDPAKHIAPGYGPDLPPAWVAVIIAGVLFFIAWMLFRMISMQRHLLSEGQCAPAVVVRISKSSHGKKSPHYTFLDRNGRLFDGKMGPHRNPPPTGTIISVIYEPDREKRNLAYPFPFIKLKKDW